MGQIEHYLYRVAPLAQGSYISVHIKGNKGGFPGWACANWVQAINMAQWWRDQGCDVYLSQGGQKAPGPIKAGKRMPDADRNGANIWCLKTLRMDVDAKQYGSIKEMDAAIDGFYQKTNIPKALFVVKSGSGGLHLYWPFDRLVTPEEWQPLADALAKAAVEAGLKLDTECTVDRTRVLRIPGTKNYKIKDHPTNVEIYYDDGGNFTYEELQQALARWISLTASSCHATDGAFEDEKNMQEGRTYAPVDIKLVAQECGHIADTLNTGGAYYSYELWLLDIGLSCHTTDPDSVAHALSNRYHAYEPTETTEKLKASQADRQKNKSLGPPSCATFQKRGAKQCATCKHRDRGSNPISIGYGRNGHAYTGIPSILPDLPDGYFRGADSFIYTKNPNGKGNICVFMREIVPYSGRVEGKDPYTLSFMTIEGGEEKEIRITGGQINTPNEARKAFGNQGISTKYNQQTEQAFWMAFLDKMVRQGSIRLPPMGWHLKDNVYGFSFNRKFISPQGEFQALSMDDEFRYGVAGEAQPWIDLSKIMIIDSRPDLCNIAAVGFGAPLVRLIGLNGFLIGGWSLATGVGKTTALSLTQALFGSAASMNGLDDTQNHVIAKAAMLKNIAMTYDEIKGTEQKLQFLRIVNQLAEGKSKGRAKQDGSPQTTKHWEMPIAYAANQSMISVAEERSGGTFATAVRIYEFECLANQTRTHSESLVNQLRSDLKDNYGHIGQIYAKFLGLNRNYAKGITEYMEARFRKELKEEEGERLWFGAAAILTAGSYLARKLDLAPFNPALMYDYNKQVILQLRAKRNRSSGDYSNYNAVLSELGNFIRDHLSSRTIVTNIIWMQKGRPPPGMIRVENLAPNKWIVGRDWPSMQIARGTTTNPQAAVLRFTTESLNQWCKIHDKEASNFSRAIKDKMQAVDGLAVVGAGTKFAISPIFCLTMNIVATPLEDMVKELLAEKESTDATDDSTGF